MVGFPCEKEKKKKAANAVTEALKQNGIYKIFFVITLEAGRFDPRDSSLISVVLEHAPDIRNYGLIINKVMQTFSCHSLL